jgi:beta-phosphoglucomutase-like phosphatase (HAD superfamily)
LLNIEARKCIAVEDSEAGIHSAKSNEIFCVALENQYLKHDKMLEADYVVSSITEIVDLLKS